jgi:magnesium-transporting ATPase (P-type)
MPTVVELLVDELLHPFYIFQIVSVTIWILQFYFIYATAIFVLATAALIFSVVQTRKNNQVKKKKKKKQIKKKKKKKKIVNLNLNFASYFRLCF